jgi:branched-subunit amino acid ABC-type transport system permease component
MLSTLVVGTLVQMGVVIILCVGFTFTYMVEKFPNFGHTAIATLGTVVSFSLVKIYGFDPYSAIPFAMLFCGFVGLLLYFLVVRPIKATGAHEITITFAFFAIAEMLASLVSIYSYWFLFSQSAPTSGFSLMGSDFQWEGYPGVLLVTLPICVVLVVSLYLFFTKMKQGIAFRAVAEDEPLASSLGININTIHTLSWFMTGALAGLAGGLIPLWQYTGLGYNDQFLVLVMAGSVMGGLHSVTGAVIGGFLAAFSQKALGIIAIALFGLQAVDYEALYPMLFIVFILMIEPNGVMGIFEKPHRPIKALRTTIARLQYRLTKSTRAT